MPSCAQDPELCEAQDHGGFKEGGSAVCLQGGFLRGLGLCSQSLVALTLWWGWVHSISAMGCLTVRILNLSGQSRALALP